MSLASLLGYVGPHGVCVCSDPLEGTLPQPPVVAGWGCVKCEQWALAPPPPSQVLVLGLGGLGLLCQGKFCVVFSPSVHLVVCKHISVHS